MKKYKIGVISDTHGLLRPEVLEIFNEVDCIIHAGDVGDASIIQELRKIAPVTVVRGNCDNGELGYILRNTEVLEVGDINVYVLHNLDELDLEPKEAGFDVVISGHSHKACEKIVDDVLYFNPGSAGPRRFTLPISLGVLKVHGKKIQAETIEIPFK
ncbi:metallophosphoesterase family protein [Clostridium massiliodielmoense]|uniref:metallophosphoesterase family protein n=1 Tax=Clostridium massiliodielmoense TaxID=1776385 RepID=UPI000A2678CA|nr:metallophosphoesterase family protein [Clostridium massiliodielmoense]